jgi:hypothetical protein
VSAEPPPPPQVSPDGRFYWDGERWVPMAQPPTPQVQAFPEPSRSASAPQKRGLRERLGMTGALDALGQNFDFAQSSSEALPDDDVCDLSMLIGSQDVA